MADKYTYLDTNGDLAEREGTASSAGGANAGDIVALDGTGRIASNMMPVGVGAETVSVEASENLLAGDFVNIHNSAGAKVRKADASSEATRAHGFVLSSATAGNSVDVYTAGTNTALSGLTIGEVYFLSATTAGEASATVPATAGQIAQKLGVATSATSIAFEHTQVIIRA